MRTVQLMKKKNIYIFRVRIIAKKNWFNNHCQKCVRAYEASMIVLTFLHEVMIGNHRNKTTES